MLAMAGALLIVLGVLSGGLLLAAALGLAGVSAGAVLWLLFPLFSVLGYVLFVIGAGHEPIRRLSLLIAGLLMLLAIAAAAALVLAGAAVLSLPDGPLALWYVLVVAGALAAVGAAGRRSAATP